MYPFLNVAVMFTKCTAKHCQHRKEHARLLGSCIVPM